MANDTQRPSDLVPVNPNGYVSIETAAGQQQESGRPADLYNVDPEYISKQVNPYNTVTGVAAGAGAARPLLEKAVGSDATGRRSMEQYLKNQISHKYPGLDLSSLEKELRSVTHPKERVATMHEIQNALKTVEGRGIPGVGPVDLTGYEKAPKPTTLGGKVAQPFSKVGEYVENLNPFTGSGMGSKAFRTAGRGGLGFGAGYEGSQAYNKLVEGDVAGAVPHASSALGYGALLSTNPKVKGAGAVLAGIPLVGKMMGNAQAAPMSREEATGTAFDVGTGLLGPAGMMLTPSQLGAGTIQPKREVYRPGMNVLQGSTLPQQRAEGGLVYLAKGGESKKPQASIAGTLNEVGTVQGPSLASIWQEHLASLPETTEKNLRHQQDVMNRAMPFDPKTGQLVMKSDPKAMNELTEMVSGIGGVTKAVKDFVPKATNILKASEALGKHEDKYLGLTQTDNMGIHGGRQGGNRFPTLQQTSPVHAEDMPVWAMDSEQHAQRLIDSAQNPNLIFSTYIGKDDQLKSNKTVFNDIMKQHYDRNLTPEQIDLVNKRIATVKDAKGRLVFPQAFDIRDKFAAQELGGDTFARRGKMADIIGLGEGVGKTRGGIALPQYQDILRSHRDPLTEGVPTSSIGTQLFTVDPTRPTFKTDKYHTDYQYPTFGKNTGDTFSPFPHSMLDWHEAQVKKTGLVPHGNAWFNYMQTPQHLNEKFLTRLQKEGFADGGSVMPSISLDVNNIPNPTGMPGVGYMQTPPGAVARLQMEKELANAKLRAGVSGMAMALPGQQGVKPMAGQVDIGAKIPMGRGNLDISANRSINQIPGRGYDQGINARYTMPFKKGGLAQLLTVTFAIPTLRSKRKVGSPRWWCSHNVDYII